MLNYIFAVFMLLVASFLSMFQLLMLFELDFLSLTGITAEIQQLHQKFDILT